MLGIFDSGSGGLTIAKALRSLAPLIDIVYFGDTANLPYGEKSQAQIQSLTLNAMSFLRSQGSATIVSACNSVSSSVIRPMFDLFGVHSADVIEMVEPAIKFLAATKITNVALLATPATVNSQMYQSAAAQNNLEMTALAIPDLAKQIEDCASNQIILKTIENALVNIPENIQTILLGCTHYPLRLNLFESAAKNLGKSFTFIDPALAVAQAAILEHGAFGTGQFNLICTKPSPGLEFYSKGLLGINQLRVLSNRLISNFK